MIADRIRQIRKDQKMTQTQFANSVLLSMDGVSQIERGVTNPSSKTIELICREFNVSREWLETGEGEMYLLSLDMEEALFEELRKSSTASAQAIRMAIKYYFHLDAEGRKIIDGLVESLLGQ